MIRKLFTLLLAATVAIGGAWYFLRDTREKQVERLHREVERKLQVFGDPLLLREAEQLNEQILELVPNQAVALLRKAHIDERKGTAAGAREALRVYNDLVKTTNPALLREAVFRKVRLCRWLGLLAEAKATLLSCVDQFPYEVFMALGQTALDEFAHEAAIGHFRRAVEVASKPEEEARAWMGEAEACRQLAVVLEGQRRMASESQDSQEPHPTESPAVTDLRARARERLTRVRDFFAEDIPDRDKLDDRLVLLAAVLDQLAALNKDQPRLADDVGPYEGAWLFLTEAAKTLSLSEGRGEPPQSILIPLAAFRLRSANEDESLTAGQRAQYREDAEKGFHTAIRWSVTEAKSALRGLPANDEVEPGTAAADREDVLEYAQKLVRIVRIYLETAEFKKVLEDSSDLALAERVADAREASDGEISNAFALLTGAAHLKAQEVEKAERYLDAYLESKDPETRALGLIEVIGLLQGSLPEDPVVFRYLDRLDSTAGLTPSQYLPRRVTILARARRSETLAEEAQRRLDRLLDSARESAESSQDFFALAQLHRSLNDRDTAVEVLREGCTKQPGQPVLRELLASILFEKAEGLAASGQEASSAYEEALNETVRLFLRSPSDRGHLEKLTLGIRLLERDGRRPDFAPILRELYPAAQPSAVDDLSHVLVHYFLQENEAALASAERIPSPRVFGPWIPFLKGLSYLRIAAHPSIDDAAAPTPRVSESDSSQVSDPLALAKACFQEVADYPPAQLELLNLELVSLLSEANVPEDRWEDQVGKPLEELIARARKLDESGTVGEAGKALVATALWRQFQFLYRQPAVKNSELLRILGEIRRTLREGIRKNPRFAPFYLALAQTLVLDPRADAAGKDTRHMLSADLGKAISVLKAVPNPNEPVLATLATYLQRAGDPGGARPYLEALALLRPSAHTFSQLLTNYFQTRRGSWEVLVADQAERPPQVESDPETQRLYQLRESFETIPEFLGLRLAMRGMALGIQVSRATDAAEKAKLLAQLTDCYERALQAYETAQLPVPLLVLNNFAWYLAESGRPEQKERALEIAQRAVRQAPDPQLAPDVHDTLGWALYQNGRYVEAKAVLKSLVESHDRPDLHYHMAVVQLALKEYDEALEQLRRALDSTAPFEGERDARELEPRIREARRRALGGR